MRTLTLILSDQPVDPRYVLKSSRTRTLDWTDLSGLDRGTKARILYEEVQRLEGSVGETAPKASEEPKPCGCHPKP